MLCGGPLLLGWPERLAYSAAIGMRQPVPKARPLTLSRGAAWRRLN